MLWLAFGLVAAAQAAPAHDPRQNYQSCPGQDVVQRAADVEWGSPESRLDAHRALREALHVPMPEGSGRILWYSNSVHFGSATFSVVAVRRADGIWHVDGAGQRLFGMVENERPTPMSRMERDLSTEESRRLDALLEDACLYAGPTYLRDPGYVGGGHIGTLEIETAGRRWIGSWSFVPTRQENDVLNLIGEH